MPDFLCTACGTYVAVNERCKCNREWICVALCYFTITFIVQILAFPGILQTGIVILVCGSIALCCYLGCKGKKEDRIKIGVNQLNYPILGKEVSQITILENYDPAQVTYNCPPPLPYDPHPEQRNLNYNTSLVSNRNETKQVIDKLIINFSDCEQFIQKEREVNYIINEDL